MGFCWLLCSSGFLLVVLRRWVFVGCGGQICGFGHAQWRCRWFGRESWVSPLVWPWVVGVSVGVAMGRGCGVGFFFAWVAG